MDTFLLLNNIFLGFYNSTVEDRQEMVEREGPRGGTEPLDTAARTPSSYVGRVLYQVRHTSATTLFFLTGELKLANDYES